MFGALFLAGGMYLINMLHPEMYEKLGAEWSYYFSVIYSNLFSDNTQHLNAINLGLISHMHSM